MDTEALKELVDGILAIFDTQVVRIVLYGSYARGTNTSESDVDVALLLDGNLSEKTEDKLSDLFVGLNLKYDKVFSVIDIDYAIFHDLRSVTALAEFDFSKHSGVIVFFNRTYVKEGIFDKSISKLIDTAYRLREKADCQDFIIISKDQTIEQLGRQKKYWG